jgi:hypothetical protein
MPAQIVPEYRFVDVLVPAPQRDPDMRDLTRLPACQLPLHRRSPDTRSGSNRSLTDRDLEFSVSGR